MVRERLDRRTALGRRFVTMRGFIFDGADYETGDPFPIDKLSLHQVLTLHGSRYIDALPVDAAGPEPAEDRGVTLTETSRGNYEITAAWLPEPIKARGRAKAEAEAERVRTEGAPLGFIEGGTAVTVEQGEGGWYTVAAPWMEAPEKVRGRELAETRQREIHEAGEPDLHHGVRLTSVGNGWFDVKADWAPETEKVQGKEAATAKAAELRAAGPPKADPLKVGDTVLIGEAGGKLAGRYGSINAIDGDSAQVYSFGNTEETKGELTEDTVPLAALSLAPTG